MEVINGLNSHSGAIIAITTVVLAIITGVYVCLTGGILKESRLMRLYAHKPEIVIYLRSHPAHIALVYLCVENTGTAHAYDVQFTLDLSFKPDGVESLGEVGFLQRGIKHLPRGQKRECFLTSVIGRPDLFEKSIEITVTYKDSDNKKYPDCFCLDFGEFKGSSHDGSPLFEIAEAMKGIEKSLDSISTKPHQFGGN